MINNNQIEGKTIYLISAADLREFGEALIKQARADAEKENKEQTTQELATRKDVCDYLHISYPTFHKLVNDGVLPTIKVGHKTYCDKNELQRLVASGRIRRYQHRAGRI